MALTRGLLEALGIEREKSEEIIKAHTETVEGLKAKIAEAEKARDEAQTAKAKAEKAQGDLQKKVDAAEAGENPYKAKYEETKKAFDEYRAEGQRKEEARVKTEKLRQLLRECGIAEKRIDTVLKVTDLASVKIVDGEIEGADEMKTQLKTEWADFIVSETTHGADVATPPVNGVKGGKTKEEILAISDPSERQAQIAANLELFGH